MNKIAVIEQALNAAKPVLHGEVLALPGLEDHNDAIVKLARAGQDPSQFEVQVRHIARTSDLAWYRSEKELGGNGKTQLLLISPYLSAKLAEECQRTGINFLDTAGNVHLDLPGTHVFITGKPRPKELRIPSDQSALRKASTLRVIFALLTIDGLAQQPVRSIAEAAGAALGSTSNAIEDLAALGFITGAARQRRVANIQTLQMEWARQYPISLRGKLKPQRYACVDGADWRGSSLLTDEPEVALGGEVAAAAITQYINPASACIYSWLDRGQLLRKHRLRPDPEGPIEVLDAFWPLADQAKANAKVLVPAVAPLLLVYSDLMASNEGRSVEVAGMLLERLKNA
ncbi:hypothetical protein PMI14_02214 [Acidovorax sp. CF316]|uniref:type IV toxin-antitoxin system AbiEi family antitoxin n=1 Tax=Acidovorax sp. CF316 TaxID=1144317 RepID=UPI00026BC6F4|nr:type IV toxin-antitoxin system AbiEi family antitoxin [Acidovorax sp. CF316]EJE53140.1 hypothetical protein PMI14_02214 [Acidovorax sp. CF316]